MSQSGEWAHRTPSGKRATWNGDQPLSKATKFTKTANQKKGSQNRSFGLLIKHIFY
ncbi:hypothetical protein [Bacillus sp. NEB1478]|uniref:hypothetical protein n=1 Tax=Bacillus sp. NEB1478 TaxID=3073816 RepID=UPI0028733814|nr:hypothetical protein [Bacillus sp. NEB1478]WNB92627.1 hypothetical protein RGB74_02865 [Bacillus sp. NEB1478]